MVRLATNVQTLCDSGLLDGVLCSIMMAALKSGGDADTTAISGAPKTKERGQVSHVHARYEVPTVFKTCEMNTTIIVNGINALP